ncbi:tetraacyldisaccharide 4'-kinase [Aliikangiella maris]|uniref:Tetraacyldisaccharide 4'-kinase n=2 Tax=Aliikangiella maris TaxID=3162458 RepID=A0ABV3MKV1_9GAMM
MRFIEVIEKFWYSRRWYHILIFPLSIPFYLLVWFKYFFYRRGIFSSASSRVPVLVVGNLSVGGTGKTPFISFLTQVLVQNGYRVGIVSRGYGAKITQFPHVISTHDSVAQIGDEAYMQFQKLGVPMAIAPQRAQAVNSLSREFDLDVIISDDGLQHYAMAREFEVLLVDGQRGLGNQMVLPFGPLREPSTRIKTVNWVVVNQNPTIMSHSQHQLKQQLLNYGKPLSYMTIKPVALVHLASNEAVTMNNLKDQSVTAVCGIGNPTRFFETLAPLCQKIDQVVFSDHHEFCASDFVEFDAQTVVMTEKDAVKCHAFAQQNWYYLKISATLNQSDTIELFNLLEQQILQHKPKPR